MEAAEKAEEDNNPFIYGLYTDAPDDPPQLARYKHGILEYRNEFSERKYGAFWARWLHKNPNDLAGSEDSLKHPDHIEFSCDAKISPIRTEISFIESLELDVNERRLTLNGKFFDPDHIISIYFVSDPKRKYKKDNDEWLWDTDDSGESCLIEHGGSPDLGLNWENITRNYDGNDQMTIILPVTWNPPRRFWRPVLKIIIYIYILKPLADRMLEESEKISINEILNSFNEIKKEQRNNVNFKDINKKAVFVVHGRDENNRKAIFKFLKAIGLDPIEWEEAIKMTGKPNPHIDEILIEAYNNAQAILVLFPFFDIKARLERENKSNRIFKDSFTVFSIDFPI